MVLYRCVGRYRDHFLALAFYPPVILGYLDLHAGLPRPEFTAPGRLWKKFRSGNLSAGTWLLLDVVMRVIGTTIGLAGQRFCVLLVVCAAIICAFASEQAECRSLSCRSNGRVETCLRLFGTLPPLSASWS